MGYRWECYLCDYVTFNEGTRKEHGQQIGHAMWGGSKVWSYPNGEYHKWFRKNGYGRDFSLYNQESNDAYIRGDHIKQEEKKEHPNRIHRTPSKRRGCPKCNKSENIRYVSKGKLICKKCDLVFEKGEKI